MPRAESWLKLAAGAIFAFLYLPLAVVVLFSFNDSRLNAEWVGFTLDWYRVLFADTEMLNAALNSLLIAVISSAGVTSKAGFHTPAAAGAIRRPCWCATACSRPSAPTAGWVR